MSTTTVAQAIASGQEAFQWVLAVAGTGVATALVSGFFARRKTLAEARKTGVDATSVLSAASVAQVESWRKDVETLREDRNEDTQRYEKQIAALNDRMAVLERQASEDRQARYELVQWARSVVALLEAAGIAFPTPPSAVHDSGGHPPYRRGG